MSGFTSILIILCLIGIATQADGQVEILIAKPTNITVTVTFTNIVSVPKPQPPASTCTGDLNQYQLELNRWYLQQMGLTAWPKDVYTAHPANHLRLLKAPPPLDISPGARFRKERGE